MLVRVLLTATIFQALRYTDQMSPGRLLVLLLGLDVLDCNRFFHDPSVCKTHAYQSRDKMVDLIAYCVSVLMFPSLYDAMTLRLLYGAIALRFIGVIAFMWHNRTRYLRWFPDLVNGIMLGHWAWTKGAKASWTYWVLVGTGMVSKIAYEHLHHVRDRYA